VASLLELGIEDVPAFEEIPDDEPWYPTLRAFFARHGYECEGAYRMPDAAPWAGGTDWNVDGYYICSGETPGGVKEGHAVIYHNGALAHDPHPGGRGLSKQLNVYLIRRANGNGDLGSKTRRKTNEHP